MTPRTTQSPDEYRVPLTPDGTVEFVPDATGTEQVDFRRSNLDRMTREAIDFATDSQTPNPDRPDTQRGEFGERIIGLVGASTPENILDSTHPRILLEHTSRIIQYRTDALNDGRAA